MQQFIRVLVLWLLVVGVAFSAFAVTARAEVPESPAREAILIDAQTGTILYQKNAYVRMPTASMSKTITAYMIFDALKQGRFTLDSMIPISEKAWRMEGSKTFVELGKQVRLEDLIRGMLIQSGNDATVAIAEAIGGTEEGFASMANARAKEIGLKDSHFVNATGWPDPNHYSTAYDLAALAQRLIKDFPEHYHYFSEPEFTYHGIRQQNRDPLLRMNIGADGLKTGHTEESGYGLIGSAVQNGRRLVMVINGLPNSDARADEAARLMTWGFAATDVYPLLKATKPVDMARVWMGSARQVPLAILEDVTVAMTREARMGLKAEVVLNEPVSAPIKKGQQLGILRVSAPGVEAQEYPLYAAQDVERLGMFGRFSAKLHHVFLGGEL